jgi:Kdo2-lipid IVA lauroyltransferase/acyltransferase
MNWRDKAAFFFLSIFSRILAILPFRMLYLLSDFTFILVYVIVRYRRKVVCENISKAYPLLDKKERLKIEKEFFHFFCDYIFESLSVAYLSPDRLNRHMVYKNPEVLDPYFEQKKGIILVAGHYGNWELTAQMPAFIKHTVLVVYKPQSNQGIDHFFINFRARYGMVAVPMSSIAKRIATSTRDQIPTLTYLLSDQRPIGLNVRYWTSFLRQETPVLLGVEKLSAKYKQAVFFLDLKRVKRGTYEASFILLEDQPENTREFEITEKHVRYLEQMIDRNPGIWLWSHRRWKHRNFSEFLKLRDKTPDSPGVDFNPDYISIPREEA